MVRQLATPVAVEVGAPAGLLVAMAVCESGDRRHPEAGCNERARRVEIHLPEVDCRPDESRGLMQVLCSTARELGVRNLEDLWDPRVNLALGARYLRQVHSFLFPGLDPAELPVGGPGGLSRADRDRWLLAVAGYNAGMGRTRKAIRAAGLAEIRDLVSPGRVTVGEVLSYLDGDASSQSANERITSEHVSCVSEIWSAEEARSSSNP